MLTDYLLSGEQKKKNGLSESTHDLYSPSMIPIQVAICLLVPHFPESLAPPFLSDKDRQGPEIRICRPKVC